MSRAMQDVRLEYILEKLFERFRAPLQLKVSASGKPVYLPDADDPSGRTPDYTKPVYDESAKAEIAKVIVSTLDRQAKLNALDLPKPKSRDESDEFENAWKWAKRQRMLALELAEKLSHYEAVEIDADDYAEAEIIE